MNLTQLWIPLATVSLFGFTSGLIAVYIVLRRMSFVGDGLAHASLAGVAIAWLAGWHLTVGAAGWALVTALAIRLMRKLNIATDAAIGVTFTFSFALGIVLMGEGEEAVHQVFEAVFGNLLAVGQEELYLTLATFLVVGLVLLLLRPVLDFVSFDPEGAAAFGIPVLVVDLVLMVLITLVVVAGLKSVGVLMVAAMVVTPAVTALQVSRSLPASLLISGLVGAVAGLAGTWISLVSGISTGATVVLVVTLIFLIVWLGKLLSRMRVAGRQT